MMMQQPMMPQPRVTPQAGYRLQALGSPGVEAPVNDAQRWLDYWKSQRNTDMYKRDASYRARVEAEIAKYSALLNGAK